MSESNGVIRIGRKGLKKFAFGEDGAEFSVDVVKTWQEWINIDESVRDTEGQIKAENMPLYHKAVVDFAAELSNSKPESLTVAEGLEFIAKMREQYEELADFFQPKKRKEQEPSASSATGMQFTEEVASAPSTN